MERRDSMEICKAELKAVEEEVSRKGSQEECVSSRDRFSKKEASSILDVRSEGPLTEESSRSMLVAILNIGLKDWDQNVSF